MRRAMLIGALVVGTFGIGVSEFVIMGLLPQIAADLAGRVYRDSPNVAMAAAGGLVSSYALGVVVGTAVTPALVRRLPERAALAVCAVSMLLWTALTALAPTLAVAIVCRFLAALTHATYTGMSTVLVARLLGKNYNGRGNAIVMSGLTLANLLGVPVLTMLGSGGDSWRLVLGACCVLFAVPAIAVTLIRVEQPMLVTSRLDGGHERMTYRAVALMGIITLITGGGFTVMTYAAPVSQWSQGSADLVPVAGFMLGFGVGMNLGNLLGGWAADRSAERAVWVSGILGLTAAVLLVLPLHSWVPAMLSMLLIGFVLAGVNPAAMVLYLCEIPHRPRFAASLASGTANLGSVLGSLVGAALLAARGPAAVPIGAAMLALVGTALLLTRRHRAVRQVLR